MRRSEPHSTPRFDPVVYTAALQLRSSCHRRNRTENQLHDEDHGDGEDQDTWHGFSLSVKCTLPARRSASAFKSRKRILRIKMMPGKKGAQ